MKTRIKLIWKAILGRPIMYGLSYRNVDLASNERAYIANNTHVDE